MPGVGLQNYEGRRHSMITEKIDSQLMDNCIKRYKLSSTMPDDIIQEKSRACGNPLVPMRLDKSPNMGAGFMSPDDQCFFYGCPRCSSVLYDEDELNRYTCGPKTTLKVFLAGIFGIE
jgi:hypothetical protein